MILEIGLNTLLEFPYFLAFYIQLLTEFLNLQLELITGLLERPLIGLALLYDFLLDSDLFTGVLHALPDILEPIIEHLPLIPQLPYLLLHHLVIHAQFLCRPLLAVILSRQTING